MKTGDTKTTKKTPTSKGYSGDINRCDFREHDEHVLWTSSSQIN